jgi:hypothetical protein
VELAMEWRIPSQQAAAQVQQLRLTAVSLHVAEVELGGEKEIAFSEHHLTYTLISGLLIGAPRSVLAYFLPYLTTSLFYISHSIQPLNLKLGSLLKKLRYILGKIV